MHVTITVFFNVVYMRQLRHYLIIWLNRYISFRCMTVSNIFTWFEILLSLHTCSVQQLVLRPDWSWFSSRVCGTPPEREDPGYRGRATWCNGTV